MEQPNSHLQLLPEVYHERQPYFIYPARSLVLLFTALILAFLKDPRGKLEDLPKDIIRRRLWKYTITTLQAWTFYNIFILFLHMPMHLEFITSIDALITILSFVVICRYLWFSTCLDIVGDPSEVTAWLSFLTKAKEEEHAAVALERLLEQHDIHYMNTGRALDESMEEGGQDLQYLAERWVEAFNFWSILAGLFLFIVPVQLALTGYGLYQLRLM